MKHGHDIECWARSQIASSKSDARKKRLADLLKEVKSADPNRYPAGSPQHTLALYRGKDAMKHAMGLGYEPPEQALAEFGLHVAELGLGL